MRVHLSAINETELDSLLRERAAFSEHHLVEDPCGADLILLVGDFAQHPTRLLDNKLYRKFPERCAVYTEDDNYLPLLAGVYCSATKGTGSGSCRVYNYSYVSASGRYTNPYIAGVNREKRLLFSFQGGSTSLLRKRMFNLEFRRPDVLIENTSAYYHWDLSQPGREERQRRYAETLVQSHFVVCPRGAGAGSIRLFEVMQSGVAPVLIADNYVLPPNVPWEDFLLRISERDIGRIPDLLAPYIDSSAERGRKARAAWETFFAPEKEFSAIVGLAHKALAAPKERKSLKWQSAMISRARRRRQLRDFARNGVLSTFRLLGLKFPYQMNR